MSFDQSLFAPLSAHSAASPKVYTYRTTDDYSVVTSPGYFERKKFQLEKDDIIISMINGAVSHLVVLADTSTVGPGKITTRAILTKDTDDNTYLINSGVFEDVGLSATIAIENRNTQDVVADIYFPLVSGSQGNTAFEVQVLSGDDVFSSRVVEIGNGDTDLLINLSSARGDIINEGPSVPISVKIKNIDGTVTVTNSVGVDDAELVLSQFIDVVP